MPYSVEREDVSEEVGTYHVVAQVAEEVALALELLAQEAEGLRHAERVAVCVVGHEIVVCVVHFSCLF